MDARTRRRLMGTEGDVSDNSVDKACGRLQVTYLPISALKLEPRNPRIHTRKQVQQIARSIQAFSCVVVASSRMSTSSLFCKSAGIRSASPFSAANAVEPAMSRSNEP